jgi:hypothetical protein
MMSKKLADLMASRQIRRLPVVQAGKLLGMVSLGNIAVKHEESTASHALEGVSEGVKASAGGATTAKAESTRTRSIDTRGPSRKSTTKSRTARIAPQERKQMERRIAEINQQLRISSEENLPARVIPYELSKDEIDLLYEERDQLVKKLDEDAGSAA